MRGARILLIEDDPAHILLCQNALSASRYGFKVRVAVSGEQALNWLDEAASKKESGFDAIVMDNKLPDYYGLELLTRIKERAPDSLVIMVTGYRDDELAFDALRRGAVDYLPKTQDYHKHLPRIIQLNMERSTLYASIQKLNALEEALRALNRKLVNAQEEERKRISRELHDEVGQSLATINIGLQLIRDKLPEGNRRVIDDLEEAMGDIKNVIRSLRELSVRLHPHILDDLGLVAAVRWLAGEISNRASIKVNLKSPRSADRYPPDIELLLFRICQESLTNVIKHARADRVDISIERIADRVSLKIQDNGAGFDIKEKFLINRTGGMGLVGMKERVASVGGKFNIDSSDKGTKVEATVPITEREKHVAKSAKRTKKKSFAS